MFNFFKRKQGVGDGKFEEVSEKKTTKLGYILLILMSLFLIGISQTIFYDLKSVPDRPDRPAYCIANLTSSSLKANQRVPTCKFTEIDTKFALDTQYSSIQQVLIGISELNNKISQQNSIVRTKQNEITQKEREYELSLQEKLTDEQVLFNKDSIQATITQLRNEVKVAQTNISRFSTDRDLKVRGIDTQIVNIQTSYKKAQEAYLEAFAWYKFKVFALMLVFVLPFFVLSTKLYFSFKRKNSPYTIILTAVMTSSAVLFLQVVGVFLYDVLLARWIEQIFELFLSLPALRYILYYGSVILVIAIFGGIVFFIQKTVFDPNKVALRRLKDNKCPNCSFSINRSEGHCPSCGIQLHENCENCGHGRFVHLPHCPVCGLKKNSNSE